MKTFTLRGSIFFFLFWLNIQHLSSQLYEWRGPDRTGVYKEFNLLQKWPETGPPLLFEILSVGAGFSSVTISDEAIYITGKKNDVDVLSAYTLQGKKKWETVYGKSWDGSYPDSRCTPTYYNGKIFVISGKGDLACLNTNGKILWSRNYLAMYGASGPPYGISESPLVVDSLVIVSPGGSKASIVAFNIETGNVKWEAKPVNDITQYVNPKLVYYGGKKIIITLSENNILTVDSKTGKMLWTFRYIDYFSKEGTGFTNHAITPLYKDGYLFIASGWNYTALKLKLSENGKSPEIVWKSTDMDPTLGGIVMVNKYLYSATYENNSRGSWSCLDWETGKTMWKTAWHNTGSIIAADNMLYLYEEKSGYLGLAKPTPEKLDIVSEFKITRGTGPHWAHPVIRDGNLYIRHGDIVMVFLIKMKN